MNFANTRKLAVPGGEVLSHDFWLAEPQLLRVNREQYFFLNFGFRQLSEMIFFDLFIHLIVPIYHQINNPVMRTLLIPQYIIILLDRT